MRAVVRTRSPDGALSSEKRRMEPQSADGTRAAEPPLDATLVSSAPYLPRSSASLPDAFAFCVSSLPPRCLPLTNTFGTVFWLVILSNSLW